MYSAGCPVQEDRDNGGATRDERADDHHFGNRVEGAAGVARQTLGQKLTV